MDRRSILATLILALLFAAALAHKPPDPVAEPPARAKLPRSNWNENDWIERIALDRCLPPSATQARTPDGSYCDLLTDQYAYEVEWAEKWSQAAGQAGFYAAVFNREPAVVLLLRGEPSDQRYYLRCLACCVRLGIRLETFATHTDKAADTPVFAPVPDPISRK